MKKSIFLFCKYIAFIWSYIYSLNFSDKLLNLHRILYSFWVSRFFKSIADVHFWLPVYLDHPSRISIGKGTNIGRRAMICVHPTNDNPNAEIVIGERSFIGDDCNIQCCNSIYIGNGVLIGRKVMINDSSHGDISFEQLSIPPSFRPLISKGPITIEDNVWIGEMVCILGDVHIGKSSIVGAGSIVTHDIPPYSVAVGNPAKIIKTIQHD